VKTQALTALIGLITGFAVGHRLAGEPPRGDAGLDAPPPVSESTPPRRPSPAGLRSSPRASGASPFRTWVHPEFDDFELWRAKYQARRRQAELAFLRDRGRSTGPFDGLTFDDPAYPEHLKPAALQAVFDGIMDKENPTFGGHALADVELVCDTVPCSAVLTFGGDFGEDVEPLRAVELGGPLSRYGLDAHTWTARIDEGVLTAEIMWNPYDRKRNPYLAEKVSDAWELRRTRDPERLLEREAELLDRGLSADMVREAVDRPVPVPQ